MVVAKMAEAEGDKKCCDDKRQDKPDIASETIDEQCARNKIIREKFWQFLAYSHR